MCFRYEEVYNGLVQLETVGFKHKLYSGILNGNVYFYGNYDQCLYSRGELDEDEIATQYCTVDVKLVSQCAEERIRSEILKNKTLTHLTDQRVNYGFCAPKSCSVGNMSSFWKHLKQHFQIPLEVTFKETFCYDQEKNTNLKTVDIFTFLLFFAVLLVELLSTVYDVHLGNKKKNEIFSSFSLYSNAKKLFSTETVANDLTCLNGIKAISMVCIVYGHVISLKAIGPITNGKYVLTGWTNDLRTAFYLALPNVVDTFLSISGLLVVYVYLKFGKDIRKNLHWFYLYRYLRIMPLLAAVILINISVVKFLVQGPYFEKLFALSKRNCETNWFYTLFFANNFIYAFKQCKPHSWFLAVDTHLYVLSPLILLGIRRHAKKIFLGVLTACVSSYIYTWIVVVGKNLGFLSFFERTEEASYYTYSSTFSRMPTFLIGTYFGYLLYQNNNAKQIRISRKMNIGLWTISLGTMLSICLYHKVLLTTEPTPYRSAFLHTFSRSLWSLSVCFIILSCCVGHGGMINSFLSHSIFVVTGRLTYSIYLIHSTVIEVLFVKQKQALYFSHLEIFLDFLPTFLLSWISAVGLSLVFETPILCLVKALLKREQNKEIKSLQFQTCGLIKKID